MSIRSVALTVLAVAAVMWMLNWTREVFIPIVLSILMSRGAGTGRARIPAVFVGLIFWSFVWGIWGTLLAVPMLVAVKACGDSIEDLTPLGELLGE